MTSHDIYPLAQRLQALIPEPLRRWTGVPGDPEARDRLANTLLMELTLVPGAPIAEEDLEAFSLAVVISEALAGFVTMWGCRYGNLDEDVDRAQAALVTALGVRCTNRASIPWRWAYRLTVAAVAHLIGWVMILEVPDITPLKDCLVDSDGVGLEYLPP